MVEEAKKETAADIVAKEKAKHKQEVFKKCHFTCNRCHVLHYAKIVGKDILSLTKKDTILFLGRTKEYNGCELIELMCLKCGSSFWVVHPLGKQSDDLKVISVVWD